MEFREIVELISAEVAREELADINLGVITTGIVDMQDLYNTSVAIRDNLQKDYDLLRTSHNNIQEANHKLTMLVTAAEKMNEEDVEEVEEVNEIEKANETLEELAEEW